MGTVKVRLRQILGNEAYVTNQANGLTKGGRERMKDPHCWAEATDQSPIPVAIFLKSLLPLFQYFENGIGRVGKLDLLGEGILREVNSRLIKIVTQRINEQLELEGVGAERLVLDMNEDNEFCVCSEGRRCGKGKRMLGQATRPRGRTDPEIAKR
jgi:hypothetical protein